MFSRVITPVLLALALGAGNAAPARAGAAASCDASAYTLQLRALTGPRGAGGPS
jgi:hypothetical protein